MIKKIHFSLHLLFLTIVSFAASAAMTPPDQVVKTAVDTIVNNIQANRAVYEQDKNALFNMVDENLTSAIHVQRMANLILGKYGKTANAEQRAKFASVFKQFLIFNYAEALLNFTGKEKVEYDPLNLPAGSDKAKIQARLIASDGQAYPVSLFMSNRRDDRWRAYNVEVVGINFVATYRANFSSIIQKKGVDGLIEELQQKNRKLTEKL